MKSMAIMRALAVSQKDHSAIAEMDDDIFNARAAGMTLKSIAKHYGISSGRVYQIVQVQSYRKRYKKR